MPESERAGGLWGAAERGGPLVRVVFLSHSISKGFVFDGCI